MRFTWPNRRGWTLVELLVVLAIIGLLLALLLPAVQAARESARALQCKNRLKQLGLAAECHVGAFGFFPSDGWGHAWVGDPDRGSGKDQPGSWIYNLLPYVEQVPLRKLGAGLPADDKRQSLSRLVQTPLPLFTCPSRSDGAMSPAAVRSYRNAQWAPLIPKNDYAINGGDGFAVESIWEGPLTVEQGDAGFYPWPDLARFTGISYPRSEIAPQAVQDGLSQTYLAGEKYVSRPNYGTAEDEGYNQSMYVGQCLDLVRWTLESPRPDGPTAELADNQRFGSPHPGGCHFVFCDGSVRQIDYSIDAKVHRRFGNRRDGQ